MTAGLKAESLWNRSVSFLREALRDNDEDFTRGPIRRALALLAIPMMLEMAMESIFAVVAIVVSESLLTVLSVLVFRRGTWKRHVA